MLKSEIIKKIEEASGQAYVVGDRVRVLKKSGSEFIGTIEEIYSNGFSILADEVQFFCFVDIEKMRLADPDENFYNHFNF